MEKKKTNGSTVIKRFIHHRLALIGFVVLCILILCVVFLPSLLHLDPFTTGQGLPFSAPTNELPLGVDNAGRDSFARLVYGGRVSLLVGILSTAISLLIGVPLGTIAAYYGGWIDVLIMRVADIFISFPSTIFILVLVSVLGPSMWTLIVVMGVLSWPEFARVDPRQRDEYPEKRIRGVRPGHRFEGHSGDPAVHPAQRCGSHYCCRYLPRGRRHPPGVQPELHRHGRAGPCRLLGQHSQRRTVDHCAHHLSLGLGPRRCDVDYHHLLHQFHRRWPARCP